MAAVHSHMILISLSAALYILFKKHLYRRHRAHLDAAVPHSEAATMNEGSISCSDVLPCESIADGSLPPEN